jgi:DNA-binding NarL/FixJ family response regulator
VERTRVAVYGRSLNMAGIAASLRADPTLEVVCVDPNSPAALQRINELAPAVIAFDLDAAPSALSISLLCKQPGLLLIGVDSSSNEMLALSSHPAQALSVTDLIKVIHQKESISEPFNRR